MKKITIILFLFLSLTNYTYSQTKETTSAEDLAKQLANPVAALISIPFQNNYDFNVGPLDGLKYTLNIQPVIPISIGEDWNLISRTIIPISLQKDVTRYGETEFGLGDIVQSIFFSPKEVKNGLVWGIGPIFLIPTATNNAFGIKKWAAGPNALVLKLQGQWTYGALINHMWDIGGSGNAEVNATFFQPFATYATPTGASFTIASENTQSWNNDIFGGFIGAYYAKVITVGKFMMQVGGGPKIYYGNNPFNPQWGFRLNVVSLFPK